MACFVFGAHRLEQQTERRDESRLSLPNPDGNHMQRVPMGVRRQVKGAPQLVPQQGCPEPPHAVHESAWQTE